MVSRAWRRFVIGPDQTIDRRAYTFCVLERLQDGLRRRDVFVRPQRALGRPSRQAPARGGLGSGPVPGLSQSWAARRPPPPRLESLRRQLDEAYRRTADNLPANAAVRIETVAGRDALTLTPLDKLDEPASLRTLRQAVAGFAPARGPARGPPGDPGLDRLRRRVHPRQRGRRPA